MIIICGKTIVEVEKNLEMAKQAIASGMPCGIGGDTIADVEQAMEMLHRMVGGGNTAITNPNYIGVPPIEDEDEICPNCGESYDGYYCECCGYDPDTDDCEGECDCCCGCHSAEDEDETAELSASDVDRITKEYGLPPAWAELAKALWGL